MANDQKISGNIKGNKLNISITSKTQKSQEGIQPIESSATKVASISDQSQTQQKNTLNKKAIKQEAKQQVSNNLQEVELLKEISLKLSSLNDNFISIHQQETKAKPSNENANVQNQKLDEEIFTSNFSESLQNSFKTLLDDSSFKTKMGTMLNDIYSTSVLLKQSDLTEFTANIESTIAENSYTVPSEDKGVDQELLLKNAAETVAPMNENIKVMTNGINSQSDILSSLSKSNEEMVDAYREASAQALNTNTSDPELKSINNTILEKLFEAKENEKTVSEPEVKEFETIVQPAEPAEKVETNAIDQKVDEEESKFAKDDDQKSKEDDLINEEVIRKFEDIHEFTEQTKDSLDLLVEEQRAKFTKKEAMIEQKKQVSEERHKTFSGLIKGAIEKSGSIIKKGGKALSIGGIGASVKRTFSKSKEPRPQKKTSPLSVLKEQKTISKKSPSSSLNDIGKKSTGFMMNLEKKKSSSVTKKPIFNPAVSKIAELLSGFTAYYKKVSDEQREREIFKLRFGGEDKKDEGLFSKLISSLKGGKTKIEKTKSDNKKDGGGPNIFGWLLGLLGSGLGIFKGGFGGVIKKSISWLLKSAGKALWWAVKGIGKLAGKGLLGLAKRSWKIIIRWF